MAVIQVLKYTYLGLVVSGGLPLNGEIISILSTDVNQLYLLIGSVVGFYFGGKQNEKQMETSQKKIEELTQEVTILKR